MATTTEPKISSQWDFELELTSEADPRFFQINPTLAAGDFKVSTYNGATWSSFTNVATLPTVISASGPSIACTLSAGEIGQGAIFWGKDAAGAEWREVVMHVKPTAAIEDELVRSTTPANTLDVSPTGEAGIDWANIGGKTTTNAFTNTTVATTQKVDVETIKTNPVVNAGTVTFPTTATLASTTNITAGTITTATNLTNAPTNGDLTATMKSSVTTAATAATPTAAAVTGAVGSVTAGVTVATNNDKTGYGLSSAAIQAIWDALTASLSTAGSIGKYLLDHLVGTMAAGTHNPQSGDSYARLGAPAGASVSADILAVKGDSGNLVNRLGAFTGTGTNTVLGFLKAGLSKLAGTPSDIGGTFDASTDSTEALRDRGDVAWLTATGFSVLTQADIRTAVGLAVANLDTQLGDLPTNAELATALAGADDAVLAAIAALNNLSSAGAQAAAAAALLAYGAAVAGDAMTLTSGERDAVAAAAVAKQLTESYAATGIAPTLEQALLMILQLYSDFDIAGTTRTTRKLDGTTVAMTHTLDDATTPTALARAT